MTRVWAWIAACAWALSGCAALSKAECAAADWHRLGLEAGRQGEHDWRFGQQARACEHYGIAADKASWRAGRTEGLRDYCTPERGYAVGLSGAGYSRVCPPDLELAFRRAYDSGRLQHEFDRSWQEMLIWSERGIFEEQFLRQP